jgi:DNA-binding NarL/FixJ family response regulator
LRNKSNDEGRARLFVAESTVKTHVEHIFTKLRVSDRVQAAVWAARHGLAPEQLEE